VCSTRRPQVYVTLADGREYFLLRYFPDEITFTAAEFVGRTVAEARRLHFTKDRAYLRG
jgi:hypothetical protein